MGDSRAWRCELRARRVGLGMAERMKDGEIVRSEARGAHAYCGKFHKPGAPPFEKALSLLAPDGTQEQILSAFDKRTTWNTIREWRRGRRAIAPWALALLHSKGMAIVNAINENPRGPGSRAGDRNLIRKWKT